VEKESVVAARAHARANNENRVIHRYFSPMFPEQHDVPQPVRRWRFSATIALVVINVAVYLVQTRALSHNFSQKYLELSLEGFRRGYVWELLSYQFLHGSWPHVLLNCWALFVFGRGVEWTVGKTRFLLLYFCSGIIGGLFEVMASHLWPFFFGGPTVGASAGVMGVMAAFAMLFPDQQLIMLILFVIPMKMRARSLIGIIFGITGLGIAFHNSRLALLLGGNVAHFAHLGGLLTGLAVARFYFLRKFRPPPFIE
jgi:membrane associated rhomboid family serine protease